MYFIIRCFLVIYDRMMFWSFNSLLLMMLNALKMVPVRSAMADSIQARMEDVRLICL